MAYHQQALMRSVCAPILRAGLACMVVAATHPQHHAVDGIMATLATRLDALIHAEEGWQDHAVEVLRLLNEARRSTAAFNNIMAENGLI